LLVRAVALDSNCTEALLLQGKILYKLQEFTDAAAAFENAIKVQKANPNQEAGPPKVNTYYYAGSCNEKAKNMKKAMGHFK